MILMFAKKFKNSGDIKLNQTEEKIKDAPRENKMGTMPINKLLLSISLPMMISMLVQALYNIVDSLYVARISDTPNELNAISLAFAAQNFMIAVATGTGVGINALLSKSLGEKDFKRANKVAANGVFLALCSYIVFLILGLTCIESYMGWMTDDPVIIELGRQYLSICYIFSFGIFGEIVMERLMISTGKTNLAMITQGVGAIINIVFDPIFIFENFELGFITIKGFGLGIRGAAVATVAGQIVAFIVALFLNARFNKEIKLEVRGFRPSGKMIGRIYAIGIPSIIMASIGSVMNIMFNKILYSFTAVVEGVGKTVGTLAQNAFGAYFKLQSFIFMPIFGLNNGIVPIVAYNYGAQKRRRMLGTAKLGILYAVGYMVIGLIVFQLLPDTLLSFFNMQAEEIAVGVPCLRTISLSFILAGFCIIIGSVFQALGKSIFSMFVSITRQLVVLIPAAYLLAKLGSVDYVWWAFPIAEVASAIISAIFFIRLYKTVISKIPQ